jgi:hypothetical protein
MIIRTDCLLLEKFTGPRFWLIADLWLHINEIGPVLAAVEPDMAAFLSRHIGTDHIGG